ncbi:MAG TPA: FAD-binding oxidoreductase [Bacillota bacterium]|nr:FAD-binding oxidoreductase [Bacillota bacterium]
MKGRREFLPEWYDQPAPPGSYRSLFRWGYPDRFKHPSRRLYRLMKRRLELTDEDFLPPRDLGQQLVDLDLPAKLTSAHREQLAKIVTPANLRVDAYSRLRAGYGKMAYDLMRLRQRVFENLPDAVVSPRDKDDVKAIVAYCHDHHIPVTVYGGGSSVMRGTECPRGGVSLDLREHMNRLLRVNPLNQTAAVQPGMLGPDFEAALRRAPELFRAPHPYTCGHLPQSFHSSTVGGWIVTRGAGQNSTYYGKIEQLVVSQEYVTPVGTIHTREYPAEALGPDIDQIMIGSEGAYGILVEATVKIFRYRPENTRYFSYVFRDWAHAVTAAREIAQGEFGMPSVFRLSDPEETEVGLCLYGVEGTPLDRAMRLAGYRPGRRCLLLGTADGERGFARHVARGVNRVALAHGGMNATGYAARRWEHGRFLDPYLRDDLMDYGIIIDTLECAVTWDRFLDVWQDVRSFCKSRPRTVCMSHASHFYPQGANLYFIFIGRMEIPEYLEYHAGIVDALRRSGAALSHHHGIGKLLAPWFEEALGSNQLELLRAIKRHLDPHGILNPGGTLALDLPDACRR